MALASWRPERYFRRNLAAVAAWELVWGFGAASVSNAIVLAFLTELTDSKTLIGALNLTYLLALPGLLIASYFNRHLRSRRAVVAGLHALETSAWVALGLVILLAGDHLGTTLVYIVFGMHAFYYTINGFLVAPTYELLSGVFARRYGTAQGIQVGVNRLAGTVGGLVAAERLAALGFPHNFGWTFLFGGVFLVVSNIAVFLFVEPPPEAAVPSKIQQPLLSYLASLGRLIREQRPFRLLLFTTGTLAFIQMIQGFYVVYALDRLRLEPSYAGIFASITFASSSVGGLMLGPLGDRFGHRAVMLISLGVHVASFVLVLLTQSIGQFSLALGLAAIGTMGAAIAQQNLAVDLAPPGEKGAYTALTRLVTAPATALGMLLTGVFIDHLGFTTVFLLGLLLPLAGTLATLRFREPRQALTAGVGD